MPCGGMQIRLHFKECRQTMIFRLLYVGIDRIHALRDRWMA